MASKKAICGAVLMALSATVMAAQKEARAPKRTETLACRLGTEDRHARIAVVLVGGKTDSFAYYSKWKPRTCSIYLQRNRDSYSKWADNGNITTVNLERGAFLIEHKKGEYHFVFRDIDRERYCGMDGTINGSLTIRKGVDQCQLEGSIMEEGVALGEANPRIEQVRAVSDTPAAEGASQQQAAVPAENPDATTRAAAGTATPNCGPAATSAC